MATGALSIAVHLLGFPGVAKALLVFNLAAYATLWTLVLTRLACFPGKLLADLVDHGRGPGFFTLVAGTCVLGTQVLVVGHALNVRSEEHTSELQSLMRSSYAVFCLKKKKHTQDTNKQ